MRGQMTVRSFKDRDPDLRLKRIQYRFQVIRDHADRTARSRRLSRRIVTSVLYVLLIAGAVLLALQLSPWPVETTIRHIVAHTNCKTAHAMGLAPARRGEPGYWSKLDRDNDGVACERYWRDNPEW